MSRFAAAAAVAVAGLSGLCPARGRGEDAPAQPRLAVVERGRFVVTVDAKGVFEQPHAIEVAFRPEVFAAGELEVVEAGAGGPVEKGDVLVRFRTDAIGEQVRQAEAEFRVARVRLLRLAEETRRRDEAMRLQVRRSELDLGAAEHTLEVKRSIDVPQQLWMSSSHLEHWDQDRKDSEKQFDIIVRMYEADEVLETNEKMDIEQQKRGLDRALKAKPHSFARHEILKTTTAREVADLELALARSKHAHDMLVATAALQAEQGRNELEKNELALARQEHALEKLRRDRDALTLRAPESGFAVAGQFADGKWSALDETARLLRPGARVAPNRVLFTIVRPAPGAVRTSVPEAVLLEVREGQAATLSPTALPGLTLPATVTRVARVSGDGQFEVWLNARTRHERLLPGATCKVRITTTDKVDALTVPAAAVDRAGEREVVHVWQDGRAVPRPVEVGATCGGRTEILSGVQAGDRVLAAAPK